MVWCMGGLMDRTNQTAHKTACTQTILVLDNMGKEKLFNTWYLDRYNSYKRKNKITVEPWSSNWIHSRRHPRSGLFEKWTILMPRHPLLHWSPERCMTVTQVSAWKRCQGDTWSFVQQLRYFSHERLGQEPNCWRREMREGRDLTEWSYVTPHTRSRMTFPQGQQRMKVKGNRYVSRGWEVYSFNGERTMNRAFQCF